MTNAEYIAACPFVCAACGDRVPLASDLTDGVCSTCVEHPPIFAPNVDAHSFDPYDTSF